MEREETRQALTMHTLYQYDQQQNLDIDTWLQAVAVAQSLPID